MAYMDEVLIRAMEKCSNDDKVVDQLKNIDICIDDENGNYKGLEQIIDELSSAIQDNKLD